jgi:hypothetical protein
MQSHTISSCADLESLGLEYIAYDRAMLYGELDDRYRRAGAYINPTTSKVEAARIMIGNKALFNKDFVQFISSDKIIWNLPDWQKRQGEEFSITVGDIVDVYVGIGADIQNIRNFYAGKMKVSEIKEGRPRKAIFRKST